MSSYNYLVIGEQTEGGFKISTFKVNKKGKKLIKKLSSILPSQEKAFEFCISKYSFKQKGGVKAYIREDRSEIPWIELTDELMVLHLYNKRSQLRF